MAPPTSAGRRRPVVLFYTDNGMGLGHLTRQLAIALRSRGAFQPAFLTMSAGYTLPRGLGIPTEYFPSYGRLGIAKNEWEPLIAERLCEVVEMADVRVVVVDHVSPPRIFGDLRQALPGTTFIWSRRGLWQPDKNRDALKLAEGFDLVIEPGDAASVIDQGPTATRRGDTVATAPVVMVRRDEYVGRDEARDALGIPREGTAVLVNLGDRSSDEVRKMIGRAAAVVRRHAGPSAHVFAPLHPLHGSAVGDVEGVLMAPVYPVAKYFTAFDGVISSSGYNSFHEVVDSGLPAVFVPHQGARIDDQFRRAEFASLCGRAHWAPNVFDPAFEAAVARMLRPHEADVSSATTNLLGPMRGADEFADMIATIVGKRAAGAGSTAGRIELAGDRAPTRDELVVALDLDDAGLERLAESFEPSRIERAVFAIGEADATPLYARDAVFETVMSASQWSELGQLDHTEYVKARLAGMAARYGTTRTTSNP